MVMPPCRWWRWRGGVEGGVSEIVREKPLRREMPWQAKPQAKLMAKTEREAGQ